MNPQKGAQITMHLLDVDITNTTISEGGACVGGGGDEWRVSMSLCCSPSTSTL